MIWRASTDQSDGDASEFTTNRSKRGALLVTIGTRLLKQLIRRVLVTVIGVGFEFGVLDYMYIARVSEDPWGL